MILTQGAKGKSVLDLQRKLIAAGADIEADGVFGKNTKRAVREFQRKAGIAADGIVGDDTMNAFNTPPLPRSKPGDEQETASERVEHGPEEAGEYGQQMSGENVQTNLGPQQDMSYVSAPEALLANDLAYGDVVQQYQQKQAQELARQSQPVPVQQRMNARSKPQPRLQDALDKYLR